MFYDISVLWGWLLASLVLGVAVGWATDKAGPQGPWFVGWFRWALIAFVVGLAVAWMYWLPGRLGLWLEMALLGFASCIVGCLLGGFLHAVFGAQPQPAASVSPTPFVAAASAPSAPARATAEAPEPAPPVPAPIAPVASPAQPQTVAAASPTPFVAAASAPSAPASATAEVPEPAPVVAEPAPIAPLVSPAQIDPPAAAAPAPAVEEPAAMGPVEGEERHQGQRPAGLIAPRGGLPDDLKRIKGIGPQNEGRLHALGVWHFSQIAAWTAENVHWVGSYLSFPGRIDREQWIEQARTLARGGETDFSQRVERGEVAKSRDGGTHGQDNVADLSKIKPHS